MKHLYNVVSLQDRFGLSLEDLQAYVDQGLLIPLYWELKDEAQRLKIITSGFEFAEWPLYEVERFESIIRLFQKNYQLFYHRLNTDLDTIKDQLLQLITSISGTNNKLSVKLDDLRLRVDERDSWIDLDEFCDITGYSKQYCYNSIVIIDDSIPSMYLNLDIYTNLIWLKPGKKWKCRWLELREIRKGFYYELFLEEEKRKGEFTPPPKFTLDNLK